MWKFSDLVFTLMTYTKVYFIEEKLFARFWVYDRPYTYIIDEYVGIEFLCVGCTGWLLLLSSHSSSDSKNEYISNHKYNVESTNDNLRCIFDLNRIELN